VARKGSAVGEPDVRECGYERGELDRLRRVKALRCGGFERRIVWLGNKPGKEERTDA